jgi:hypothetical protein
VAGEIFVEFRVDGVLVSVSECDVRPGRRRGAVGESGEVRSFDVVEELLRESRGFTPVLGACDVLGASKAVLDPDKESDDASDGSARASPCPQSTAAPTPSVMIRPANRPIFAPPP